MQASPLLPASPEKGTPFYPPPDMVVWAYDCATCFASVTPRVQITKRLLSGNEKHQHHRNNEILLLIADIFKVNKCIFFFFFLSRTFEASAVYDCAASSRRLSLKLH